MKRHFLKRLIRKLMYGIDHLMTTNSGTVVLFIPAIIITLSFTVMDYAQVYELEYEKVQEKFDTIKGRIDLLCEEVEFTTEKYPDRELDSFIYDMQIINDEPYTFAALYQGDELRNLIEDSTQYSQPFNPWEYPEFNRSFKPVDGAQPMNGEVMVNFTPPDQPARDVYVYWRMAPKSMAEPYIAVVAISQYTVTTQTADWIYWGSLLRNILVLGYLAVLASYVNHVGRQYRARMEA